MLRKRWLAAIFPKAVLGRAEVGVLKIIKVSSEKKWSQSLIENKMPGERKGNQLGGENPVCSGVSASPAPVASRLSGTSRGGPNYAIWLQNKLFLRAGH